MSFNFDHLRTTYFDESAELIESAYAELAALGEGNAGEDSVHALFRAIHSIKGGGGAFGFDRLIKLAHAMETLLDLMRGGDCEMDAPHLSLLLQATDALADQLAAERNGTAVPDGTEDGLIAALAEAARGAGAGGAAHADAKAGPEAPPAALGWRIVFAPHASLYRNANEPLLLVRELRKLGPVAVTADLSRLPVIDQMEPEDAYIGWTFDLSAPVTRTQIEEVFEFVADDCDLAITPADAEPAANSTPKGGSAAASDAAFAEDEHRPAGPAAEEASLRPARADTASAAPQSVRVDVAKVDRLVNLVGELVINQAMLLQLGGTLPPEICPALLTGLETLSQHLRELQEGVMAIRTQPVKSVFGRMPRLLRELSTQLDKEVRLVVTGEGTEIDKTVVEQLADPLTHLLRNAIDHGIELPHVREAAGKPRQGTIHLGAEQRSGRIIIEMSDDGRGIDRARVLERARERGLIAPDAVLSDSEIDELIFLPSFSTAAAISNVSGRGVGMDVVRRNIQSLGGRITVESRLGAGSRFLLSLPLTLAVLDGLVVAVGRESYIVPLSAIVESLRPRREEIHPVVGGGQVLAIRGSYVPLLPLHRHFDVPGGEPDASRGIVVIVETDSCGQLGLVVDDLVGQQQVVVKSLETNYRHVEGIGGATILGDGRVALILDIPGLRPATMAQRAGPPSFVGQPALQLQ